MDTRLSALPPGPFAQLATLLADVTPGLAPITLAIGDPQGSVPDFITQALTDNAGRFGTYPAIAGTPEWREAAAGWLNRRFDLGGRITADKHVLPLAGTREGLFSVLFPLLPLTKAGAAPIVAMPNPFYQCYAAAALAAAAEPLYVPATEQSGFLPDYGALPPATLERIAAVYICSPSNPEGAVADQAYWTKLFALADAYDFIVLADECYADLYFGQAPMSALTARLRHANGFMRLLSFHSLSKRSGLPGLRSGIVTGCANLIGRFQAFRNVAAPTVPAPVLAASAAAWNDEAHVAANRALLTARLAAVQKHLGHLACWRKPEGGFFLWLKVGDGEAFALKAWREQGVRLLPGAYMGREIEAGKPQSNPGFSYVRVALVNDLSTIEAALERLRKIL